MEGKFAIMSVVLVSFLVLGKIEGKAAYMMEDNVVLNSCCPNATARARFDFCRATAPVCAKNAGCILYPAGLPCPAGWTYDILKNTGDNAVNKYCKSGCVSSVCGAITTLQYSYASEVVNGAVEKCTDACSAFCTKKASISTAVETA